jgi:macrolide transport system ATP-binding/permease protein
MNVKGFWRRLRARLRYRRFDADLNEELAFHQAMKRDALARDSEGLDPADLASRTAREMGNVTLAREASRAVWIAPWIDSVRQDLAYAARSLRRQPSFTIAALTALVLALGLNTSMFTVFNAVGIRPWPVADPGRVVVVFDQRPNGRISSGFSFAEIRYFRDHARTFSGLVTFRDNYQAQIGDDDATSTRAGMALISGNLFDVMGIPAIVGRTFRQDEDLYTAPQTVAMLGHAFWQDHYGADPGVIGRTLRVNGVTFTIVGVVASGYNSVQLTNRPVAVWLPMAAMPLVSNDPAAARAELASATNCCSPLAGRLAAGATREQARLELDLLSRDFRTAFRQDVSHPVIRGTQLMAMQRDNSFTIVFALMFAATMLVLLLACANVGNLFIARAVARQREIAIRLSLGASRIRVIRQLLTESLLLSAVAGAIGIALASVVPGVILRSALGANGFVAAMATPDWRLIVFTAAICVSSCLLFGLAPAIRGTRISASSLTGGRATAPGFSLRGVLLAVQITISLILLVGATLLARSVRHLSTLDPGFTIDTVTVASIQMPAFGYDKPRLAAFTRDLAAALHDRPDLQPAALTALTPLGNGRAFTGIRLPGESDKQSRTTETYRVSPEYFDVLDIPLIGGRGFVPQDDGRDVAIINQTMARELWPNENPIGKKFLAKNPIEVIGIARDAHTGDLSRVDAMFYMPLAADFVPRVIIKQRPATAGVDIASALRTVVQRLDPRAEVTTEPLRVSYDRWLNTTRFGVRLASGIAVLALVLAAIGVFGVFAYLVQERTREIGLRMAIGAQPHQVVAFVFRSTAWATLGGLVVGVIGSFASSRLLAGQLYGISPFDPIAYGLAGAILSLAAGIATYIPAKRATRIDPITALRCD